MTDSKKKDVITILIVISIIISCGFFGYFLINIDSLLHVLESTIWVKTPCVITVSKLDIVRKGGIDQYVAYIVYSYKLKGKDYNSKNYDFFYFGHSDRCKQNIVNTYPAGKNTFCYVNPRNPGDSVLERGFPSISMFILNLFPILWIFILIILIKKIFIPKKVPSDEEINIQS